MPKKLMIVFEETEFPGVDAAGNPGKKFLVYLDGDQEAIAKIKAGTHEDKLSSSEFWGWKMFTLVKQAMMLAGAFDPANPMQNKRNLKQ